MLTIKKINKMIEQLPDDDPEFIIGWLSAQLEHVTNELELAHKYIEQLKQNITYN